MLVIINCCFYWLLLLIHQTLDKKEQVVLYKYKMNNLKEVNIKKQRTFYYLDATVKIDYFDFDNMLLYEKIKQKYFGLLHVIQKFDWCKTIRY